MRRARSSLARRIARLQIGGVALPVEGALRSDSSSRSALRVAARNLRCSRRNEKTYPAVLNRPSSQPSASVTTNASAVGAFTSAKARSRTVLPGLSQVNVAATVSVTAASTRKITRRSTRCQTPRTSRLTVLGAAFAHDAWGRLFRLAGVDALTEVLSGLEMGNVFAGERDRIAGLRIAPESRRPEMERKTPEAADLDAFAARERVAHDLEQVLDRQLHVFRRQVFLLLRDDLDQLGFGHASTCIELRRSG